MSLLNLFHTISFQPVDPLADGLAEEIAAEQNEPEAIQLSADITEEELNAYWENVEQQDIYADQEN